MKPEDDAISAVMQYFEEAADDLDMDHPEKWSQHEVMILGCMGLIASMVQIRQQLDRIEKRIGSSLQ